MTSLNEHITLNNGLRIPPIGFGAFHAQWGNNMVPIRMAIEEGYRFFDTASLYETEKYVAQAIAESGIPRSEIIIETKLWFDELGYKNAWIALDKSLKRLKTDYIDLYLIHWPRQSGDPDEDWRTLDLETWRAMEEMYKKGIVRAIGVSNFLPHHLRNILENCDIKPAVDQLELHPGYSQEAAVAYCKANDIQPIAWSPFGRGRVNDTIGNGLIALLADKYDKSIQQISLRFLLQKGILPIPKASSKIHLQENLDVFDFELTEDEISMISCMPQTAWMGEHPDFYLPTKLSNPENI